MTESSGGSLSAQGVPASTGPKRGPFRESSPGWGGLILAAILLAVAAAMLAIPAVRDGNRNIVALELIGHVIPAQRLGMHHVLAGFLFDIFFIGGYVVGLRWLVLWVGRYYRLRTTRITLRGVAAVTVVGAGILDLIEDLFLGIGVSSDYNHSQWVSWVWPAAAAMAWAKWLALGMVLAYILGAIASALTTSAALRELLWEEPDPSPDSMGDVLGGHNSRKLGIALSGGGIRSASLSLGALQVLEKPVDASDPTMGWWDADEITAISGGSNISGAWSITRTTRNICEHGFPNGQHPDSADPPCPTHAVPGAPYAWSWGLDDGEEITPEERHLMHNLGYLGARSPRGDESDPATPTGRGRTAADAEAPEPPPAPSYRPSAYATVLSGFLLNVSVLLLILWLLARPTGLIFRWLGGLPVTCDTTALLPFGRSGPGAQIRPFLERGAFLQQSRLVTYDDRLSCLSGQSRMIFPGVIWLLVGLVAIVLWVVAGKLLGDKPLVLKILRGVAYGSLALGIFLLAALIGFPYLMEFVGKLQAGGASTLSVLGGLGSLGAVVRILRKPAVKYAPYVGGVVFVLLLLFLAAYWSHGAATSTSRWADPGTSSWPGWWWLALAVLLGLYVLASPETWSIAPWYRGKLRMAYATYRDHGVARAYDNDAKHVEDYQPEPGFSQYMTNSTDPYSRTPLTVCASCTVSTRGVKTHYGIPAMSVTFSPEQVRMFVPEDDQGSWRSWSCDTTKMDLLCRRKDSSRLTTMLAVAISSAAVAPAMGRFRIGPTSMLLTFANIRLGVWMPNPRYARQIPLGELPLPRVRLGYLFKEFIGLHDPSDLYVYLTDGGHWENTGLVELLRKGDFREIVCLDADPGPGDAVKSISDAIDLAALECGATVDLNLDPLRANPESSHAPEYAKRSVNVGFFEVQNGGIGVLWYAKPGLTTEMPTALLAHRETHPDFPRTPTLDQFFDTSTFVAYRNLGRFNAQAIRTARRALLTTMRVARQMHSDAPGTYPNQFAAFCSLNEPHWACTEIVDLVRKRKSEAEQPGCYDKIVAALEFDPKAVPAG
jgi:hypothetical protein